MSSHSIKVDACQSLVSIRASNPFDSVFIGATRKESDGHLDAVWPKLAPRCMLATDNTMAHAGKLAEFVNRLPALPLFHKLRSNGGQRL